jgi:hypothetical protein
MGVLGSTCLRENTVVEAGAVGAVRTGLLNGAAVPVCVVGLGWRGAWVGGAGGGESGAFGKRVATLTLLCGGWLVYRLWPLEPPPESSCRSTLSRRAEELAGLEGGMGA